MEIKCNIDKVDVSVFEIAEKIALADNLEQAEIFNKIANNMLIWQPSDRALQISYFVNELSLESKKLIKDIQSFIEG